MSRRVRRVMLVIETSKMYGRALLDGIGRYTRAHGRWAMYVEERALLDRQPSWLRSWRGDGIIFRSNGQPMVDAVRATGLPAVDTNSHVADHGYPLVYPDEDAVARLAVDHFVDRGFRRFAFCTIERARWVEWRQRAFTARLAELGYEDCITTSLRPARGGGWDRLVDQLADWVRTLPKPIAVLAANDVCGMRLLDACRLADIAVPEQVAVLGVDNDETLCFLTMPPLSSIDLNVERIGWEAAALLDRMMARGARHKRPRWMEPRAVVERQSSDVLAIDDPVVADAVRFIREHACERITVRDIVDRARVSRRTLELRFAAALGRTPKQEILRIRLERAKTLLADTTLPIAQIASQMGYASFNYFCTVFRRKVGVSPLAYRNGQGGGAAVVSE